MIQFDDNCLKSRLVTLGDIKYAMLRLDEVTRYMQDIALEESSIMKSFNVVQMLCIERIADIAESLGFDDINELETLLLSRPYFSAMVDKDDLYDK